MSGMRGVRKRGRCASRTWKIAKDYATILEAFVSGQGSLLMQFQKGIMLTIVEGRDGEREGSSDGVEKIKARSRGWEEGCDCSSHIV